MEQKNLKMTRNKSNTCILIPSRLKSTRFPNKPLIDLNGKSMIRTVFDRCESFGYDTIVVTDSEKIADEIPLENIVMTDHNYDNGTDRLMRRVVDAVWCEYDNYINVQGDNPDVTLDIIEAIDNKLDNATVVNAYTIMTNGECKDNNSVKCIVSDDNINWYTRAEVQYGFKALGFHGYKKGTSELWSKFKRHKEEKIEDVEQLRWIQNGINLKGVFVDFYGVEINEPKDLKKWKFKQNL